MNSSFSVYRSTLRLGDDEKRRKWALFFSYHGIQVCLFGLFLYSSITNIFREVTFFKPFKIFIVECRYVLIHKITFFVQIHLYTLTFKHASEIVNLYWRMALNGFWSLSRALFVSINLFFKSGWKLFGYFDESIGYFQCNYYLLSICSSYLSSQKKLLMLWGLRK